jgi:hypothetical protein
MDDHDFDTITRLVGRSRRELLRAAGASALAALGLATLLDPDAVGAKKGGRKRRRRRCKPKPPLSACTTDKDCCTKKTKRVCAIPFGGGQGDPTVCCGSAGAACATPDQCCDGFTCGENDTCVELT